MLGEFYILSLGIKKRIAEIFVNNGDRILDLGCGESPRYHKLMKGSIVCFDNYMTKSVHVIGDADHSPFKKNSFDKIISINSFYYLKNPFNASSDLGSMLKKNGRLIMVTPFFYPIHDAPFDKFRFTEYGIRTILEKDFKVEQIETVGGLFSVPSLILHAMIKGIPLVSPNPIRPAVRLLSYLILYVPYIILQLLSMLDFLDKTRRFPMHYFVVASKK